MNGAHRSSRGWAAGLWAVLFSGIVVAWSPRYWAVSVAMTGISVLAVCWILASLSARLRLINRPDAHLLPWAAPLWKVSPPVFLLFLIAVWGPLQIAFHVTVLPQLTLDNSMVWALSCVAFLLGAQILQSEATRRVFLDLLMWSLTALALEAMLQSLLTPTRVFGLFPAEVAAFGTFLSRNQFAALMELAAPIALWSLRDRNPILGGMCFTMILAATIAAASKAGIFLVCIEVSIFLALMLFSRRLQIKTAVSLSVGIALLAGLALFIAGTDQLVRFTAKDPYSTRRELFNSTVKLIAERPWFGFGLGTWRAVYPRSATYDLGVLANEAHNDWAQWMSDGGIPFALMVAALVIWLARPAVRSIWGLGILSVMIHSYVDYPIREPSLSFLWFALAGAISALRGTDSDLPIVRGLRKESHCP
jgi:O-antigen ligase